jgi:hypothetical protein
MGEFDFFGELMTFNLFLRLEEQSEKVKFEWFKMSGVDGYRHGQHLTTHLQAGFMVPLSASFLEDIRNSKITDEWFATAQSCFEDFVDAMNRLYATIGVEVGIYKIVPTAQQIHAQTFRPTMRLLYRIAPYNFGLELDSGKQRRIRKPKNFNLNN